MVKSEKQKRHLENKLVIKIKWQEINKLVMNSMAGLGSIGLIIMISLLTRSDVSYTNWPDCRDGTDCFARFEVNESYYRICFNIDDSVKIPQYFKKQSRSRTVWINTSRYGFINTTPKIPNELMMGTIKSRGIDTAPDGKPLRQVKTGDCIERKKVNYLYIKAIKIKTQKVIWKMDLFDIDPVWNPSIILNQSYCKKWNTRIWTTKEVKGTEPNLDAKNSTLVDIYEEVQHSEKYCKEFIKVIQIEDKIIDVWEDLQMGMSGEEEVIIDDWLDGNANGIVDEIDESYCKVTDKVECYGHRAYDMKKELKEQGIE